MDNVFIARHPIFDRKLNVFAYELLFRSDPANNSFDGSVDANLACSKVITSAFDSIGLDALGSGRLLFFNVTREALLKGYATLLPKEQAVIEIPDSVAPDDEVIQAVRHLRDQGYRIALADYVMDDPREPLVEFAEFIKVDMQLTAPAQREELARRHGRPGLRLLAEKVETQADVDQAIAAGYDLLQGFFFSKPVIVAAKELPSSKVHLMMVLREIHREDLDYGRIEQLLKQDPSLGFKFLRFANSAFFGWKSHISSFKNALGLLGERETRNWVTLVSMTSLTTDKPKELLIQACLRARLMELLASDARLRNRASDLFLTGMLSLIDAALDRPMEEILQAVPVAPDVKAALLGGPGPIGTLLGLARDYQVGEWDGVSRASRALGIKEDRIPPSFFEALCWSQEALR